MTTALQPELNGQRKGVSTTTPLHLTRPSDGRTSFSEATKEGPLAPLKEKDPISGEMVKVFTVYISQGLGSNEKKKELSSHTTKDEAVIAAWRADSGGKNGTIEPRLVIKHDDGRYINYDGTVLRVGLDAQLIVNLRAEHFSALPEVDQVLFSRYNEKGEYIAAPSQS